MDSNTLGNAGHLDRRNIIPLCLRAVEVDVGQAVTLAEALEAYLIDGARDVDGGQSRAASEGSITNLLQTIGKVHVLQVDTMHQGTVANLLNSIRSGEADNREVVDEGLYANLLHGIGDVLARNGLRQHDICLLLGRGIHEVGKHLWLVIADYEVVDLIHGKGVERSIIALAGIVMEVIYTPVVHNNHTPALGLGCSNLLGSHLVTLLWIVA